MTIADKARAFRPAGVGQAFETIDMHTGGEPLRVLTDGLPPLKGSVLEKRRWFAENLDHVRTALMWEPRGHADMYGAVLTASDIADFDVFFLHNEGYSTMCGHAILALTRLVVETGMVAAGERDIGFCAPCGLIQAKAHMDGEHVVSASFRNVASYVALSGGAVQVEGLGCVAFDIAYGGAYYAIVEAEPLGLSLDDAHRLIDFGRRIKRAVVGQGEPAHPFEPDLSFLYGVIFTGRPTNAAHHSRNVCIFADGEVDRSATGSGVSARAALHYARGELALGETAVIESITGSTMSVRVVEETRFGDHAAVIPEVGGQAHFTGRSTFWIEPSDPFASGFLVR
jgi:proline racemase